jgi:hypothetical protein
MPNDIDRSCEDSETMIIEGKYYSLLERLTTVWSKICRLEETSTSRETDEKFLAENCDKGVTIGFCGWVRRSRMDARLSLIHKMTDRNKRQLAEDIILSISLNKKNNGK